MSHVYTARRSHFGVVSIDKALSAGEFHSLMKITKVHDFADLLTADLDSSYQQSADDAGTQMQTSKCNYCKPFIKQDILPARCVLNGLQTVPIPPELAKLDCLNK